MGGETPVKGHKKGLAYSHKGLYSLICSFVCSVIHSFIRQAVQSMQQTLDLVKATWPLLAVSSRSQGAAKAVTEYVH